MKKLRLVLVMLFIGSAQISFAQLEALGVIKGLVGGLFPDAMEKMAPQVVYDPTAAAANAKANVATQAKWLENLQLMTKGVKTSMEVAGSAKEIYASSQSALEMLKTAFGDFKSAGDLMAIYNMGQLKMLNEANRWERDHSQFKDYNQLYRSATRQYRYNGQLDVYRIAWGAANQGVSVTGSLRSAFIQEMQYSNIEAAYLIRQAEMLEAQADEAEALANKLAYYAAFTTMGGASVDKFIKSTATMDAVLKGKDVADYANKEKNPSSGLFGQLSGGVAGIRAQADAAMGDFVKGEMDGFLKQNGLKISPSSQQEIHSAIRGWRSTALENRMAARKLREEAARLNYSAGLGPAQVIEAGLRDQNDRALRELLGN